MLNRDDILDSLEYVVNHSKHVKTNHEAIEKFVSVFTLSATTHWSHAYPLGYIPQTQLADEIEFLFLIGNQAFCYWGSPKWTIEYKGQKLDGWWAAVACFQRAIEKGVPILDGKYLAKMSLEQARELFAGTPDIPLLKERQLMLNQIGQVLVKKYRGRFSNFFFSSNTYSINLVKNIAKTFTGFDDFAKYKDRKVYFFKKAQLVVNDIYHALPQNHPRQITGITDLTGTADYKIPAILRKMGILVYTEEFAQKIDQCLEIPERSEPEIEIRAHQLWSVKLIYERLKEKYPILTSGIIQDILWIKSQDKSVLNKPYHHTKTIYY